MFNRIDTSQDRRLSFAEFKLALAEIQKWGVVVDDAKAAFAEVDEDGHGMVMFDEFCNWAIAKHLDLEDDDDEGEMAVELEVQEKYEAGRDLHAPATPVYDESHLRKEKSNLRRAISDCARAKFHELKQWSVPPLVVKTVLKAIMVVLGKEPLWSVAQRELRVGFMDQLLHIARTNPVLTSEQLRYIQIFTKKDDFSPLVLNRTSRCTAALCSLVLTLEAYTVGAGVEPATRPETQKRPSTARPAPASSRKTRVRPVSARLTKSFSSLPHRKPSSSFSSRKTPNRKTMPASSSSRSFSSRKTPNRVQKSRRKIPSRAPSSRDTHVRSVHPPPVTDAGAHAGQTQDADATNALLQRATQAFEHQLLAARTEAESLREENAVLLREKALLQKQYDETRLLLQRANAAFEKESARMQQEIATLQG
jgi:hypothetical protein